MRKGSTNARSARICIKGSEIASKRALNTSTTRNMSPTQYKMLKATLKSYNLEQLEFLRTNTPVVISDFIAKEIKSRK